MKKRYRLPNTKRLFNRIFNSEPKIVLFCDTETTGLNWNDDDTIIQWSGIKYQWNGNKLIELASFNSYIKNRKPLSEVIINKIGITEEILSDAPTEEEVFPEIKDFCSDCVAFIAYNSPFDWGFVSKLYQRQNETMPFDYSFDVLAMVHDLISSTALNDKRLMRVATYVKANLKGITFHNSLDDITATVRVFEKLLDQYVNMEEWQEGTIIPKINRTWFWDNPNRFDMKRIYISTDCGQIFFDKLDRSFGKGKVCPYELEDLNMTVFAKNLCKYLNTDSIEGLAHLKN